MKTLKIFYFFFIFSFCFQDILSRERGNEDTQAESNKQYSDTEYYLKFIREPANYTSKALRSHTKLRCDVAPSRFVNEALNSSVEYKEVQNITDVILKNVRIRWFKNDFQVVTEKNRVTIKREEGNGTVASHLRIRNIGFSDKGQYSCIANVGKNSIKSSYSQLDVYEANKENIESEDGLDIHYRSLFTNKEEFTTDSVVTPTNDILNFSQEINFDTPVVKPSNVNSYGTISGSLIPPEVGICQLYTGRACVDFLDKLYVFVPYPNTQSELEEKLIAAFKVVNYSNEISSNCVGYAIPSLCFSTFPVCITPNETNALFFKRFQDLNNTQTNTYDEPTLQVHFENPPNGMMPSYFDHKRVPQSTSSTHMERNGHRVKRFTYEYYEKKNKEELASKMSITDEEFYKSLSRSANQLRRVCREDCEMLEHELCQKEYAIAKRHPEIGQKLTLEECKDLPLEETDCLQIGIEKHFGSDTCYWENGIYYRGNVNISNSDLPCSKWSSQFIYKMANHPELTGKHNYCRNPGGKEPQPWCYVVSRDKSLVKEYCDIPKCSQKIWIYIIASMLCAFCLFSLCLMLVCCRQRKSKSNATAIRNINLPNADKNIYGNSRLNSPIELSDLMTHHSNTRTNGISRVPQYSLAQIKFVEELGEGAFGKVYKGELSKDGEKIFVAVKALKENASQKTQQDFKREIELISELRHENIVCILGVVLREEPLCMLFEFMAKGDLHEFLMSKVPPEGCGLSPTQFLLIAQHIASGMEYLAAHHYVHRDLAARNCLVSDNMVVKISDFGLSRDIYSSDYYRVQSKSLLPVRWMPPESILYGKFTTESDVWSYGIVLWEIYSYGLQPYYGYSNQDVINMVRNRQLLQCPTDCPRAVYSVMKECWHQTPAKRPTFSYIVEKLSGWLKPNSNLHYDNASDSSGAGAASSQRVVQLCADPRERIPLIGNHSSSNGSLTGSIPRKLSTAGSIRSQGRLMDGTGSEMGESGFRKSSCGSLLESNEKLPQSHRDTVVKIPNVSQPFDI